MLKPGPHFFGVSGVDPYTISPVSMAGTEEAEVDDEAQLLEGGEVDTGEVEADAWASEAESEAEEPAIEQERSLSGGMASAEVAQAATDVGPTQRPPPARRK